MKDDRVYLEHIANSFRKLLEYAEGMTLQEFLTDSKTQDACVRQLEIAGEATKRISTPLYVIALRMYRGKTWRG